MTKLLLRLHAWLTRVLVNRKALEPEPVYLPCPDVDAVPEDAESDELPAPILDALKAWREPVRSTPVSQREMANRPQAMPVSACQFVVWSRGQVVRETDDGRDAARAFSKASARAGIHQFWDREHHASVPQGLRVERVIPLTVEA